MELRWFVNPATGERTLQSRTRGNNGVYGPGYECHDTGWVDVPVVVDCVPTLTDKVKENRPDGCRERLREEGRAYPKSGCAVCSDWLTRGCPHSN